MIRKSIKAAEKGFKQPGVGQYQINYQQVKPSPEKARLVRLDKGIDKRLAQ